MQDRMHALRYFLFFTFVTAFICALCLHGTANAATQGLLDNTSTGSVRLSVTKTATARISGLSDMEVNWKDGDADISWTSDVCMYSTRPSGGYTITARGDGPGGAFAMSNGQDMLAYAVEWDDGGAGKLGHGGAALTPGITSSLMQNAATDSASCHGSRPGPTARLRVTIPALAMNGAGDGSFTGNLTLLVAPN